MSTMSYKLSASIPGGVKFVGLRQKIFKLAQECFVYDHDIYYEEVKGKGEKAKAQITSESPLIVVLYFKSEDNITTVRLLLHYGTIGMPQLSKFPMNCSQNHTPQSLIKIMSGTNPSSIQNSMKTTVAT